MGRSDLPSYREHILQAQSRRFSPPRHERVIARQANFGDSLCMRNGHGKELGKRPRQLAPGTTELVGPARVAEGREDDDRCGGKMVGKNKHRVMRL